MLSLEKLFELDPSSRPVIFRTVYADADLTSTTYWLGILLSAGIATFGLVENSPAVIIGAMIISPLMGPIMATGLGLAAGDLYLAMKALIKLMASIALAVMLSGLLVWLLPFHSTTNEIVSRTNPTLLDLGIALLSGIAGSVAVNRAGGGDGTTTLPGVAIAVALMPPLCTVGFGVGSGWNRSIMGGAALLFLTNLVAIVFSAFLLFLLAGMNRQTVRSGLMGLRAEEKLAGRLLRGRWGRLFAEGAQLRWRALLLVVLLAAIAFPLQKALRQLESEAVARDVTQEVIKKLVPGQALVSQQTEVGRDTIAVRLVSTMVVAEERRVAAEREIQRRSGRAANVTVDTVASQHELAELVQRLNSRAAAAAAVAVAPPAAVVVQPLTETGDALRARVQSALRAVWPGVVPMESFEVRLSADAPEVDVTYADAKTMDPLAVQLVQTALREKLGSPKVVLVATRKRVERRR
jgi:uncharacterized hydrophobic protein (TIGR00271 family)